MNPEHLAKMQQASRAKHLNSLVQCSSGIMTRSARIQSLIDMDCTVVAENEWKIKTPSRLRMHRMNLDEQDAHRRKQKAQGYKTTYWAVAPEESLTSGTWYALTKIEASSMTSMQGVELPVPDPAQKPHDTW